MSDFTTITLEVADAIATLTLNRPKAGNALGAQSGKDLRRALVKIAGDPGIRLLVIKAQGKAFCVGGDLAEFAHLPDLGPAVQDMVIDYHAACTILAGLDVPILAVVQGPVAGAGLALIALADHVISASSATFTYAYPSVGLSADGGVTWLLPRVMGLRAFRSFVIDGRSLSADEAMQTGLVSHVVTDEALNDAATAKATALVNAATRALGAIRRLALESYAGSYSAHLVKEMDEITQLASGNDASGAIKAVLDRRAPQFAGK